MSKVLKAHAETWSGEDVLCLLREQAALYGRLELQAERQHRLVTRDDTETLLALLADRQRISVELQRLAQQFEPVRREWSSVHQSLSRDQRNEADSLLSEIKERLRRVMESDEQDARALSARKQSVATALRSTHTAGEAISAYRSAAGMNGADRLDEAT
jgi:endonuclease/exonuclease/phosphatase (EEP) superfamily protein YafD